MTMALHLLGSTTRAGPLLVLILYSVQAVDGAPLEGSVECADTDRGWPRYYDQTDGQCHKCLRCEVGFGLSQVCGNGAGKEATCIECPSDSFSPDAGPYVCEPCRKCDNTMNDGPCTPTTDRRCGPCQLGYFRYQARDDQCASCEDELLSHRYPDCHRSTPVPVTIPVADGSITTNDPSNASSLSPSIIVVIVIIGLLALIVFVAVGVFCCRRKICCSRQSTTGHVPVAYKTCNQNGNGSPKSDEKPHPSVAPVLEDSDVETATLVQAIPCVDPPTPSHSSAEDQNHNDNATCSTSFEPTMAKPDENASSSDNQPSTQDEGRRREVEEKLKRACELTKGTSLGDMHLKDRKLLDVQFYVHPQKEKSECRFTHRDLAILFDVDSTEINRFQVASDVINHVANTDQTMMTVADFLQKLWKNSKCNHTVEKLVDQILQRENKDAQN